MARVLIIEDEPTIALVLKESLIDEGYDVETAANGSLGLTRLRQEPLPDILLLDLFMPRISGREVIKEIREDDRLRGLPIILMTGAVPSERDFPPAQSYQAVLCKPFDLMDVILKVKQLLNEPSSFARLDSSLYQSSATD